MLAEPEGREALRSMRGRYAKRGRSNGGGSRWVQNGSKKVGHGARFGPSDA